MPPLVSCWGGGRLIPTPEVSGLRSWLRETETRLRVGRAQIRPKLVSQKKTEGQKTVNSKELMASWLKTFNCLNPPKMEPLLNMISFGDPFGTPIFGSDPNAGKMKVFLPVNSFQSG